MSIAPVAEPPIPVNAPLLTLEGITKSYGAVHALRGVDMTLELGSVHALVGDNGAGKSTLIKVISGAIQPDEGAIRVAGEVVRFTQPSDAIARGIATVFQDLALVPTRDVAHNMFLGRELVKWGLVRPRVMAREAAQLLDRLHIQNLPSTTALVSELSGGQRQAIAIGRAVYEGRSLMLLDEPTAALGVQESHQVLNLIERLREQHLAVLIVSHNLQHVFRIADRITVLRSGRVVATVDCANASPDDIVKMITGADLL